MTLIPVKTIFQIVQINTSESLEGKDLVLKHTEKDSVSYEVDNVFFSRWLEAEF